MGKCQCSIGEYQRNANNREEWEERWLGLQEGGSLQTWPCLSVCAIYQHSPSLSHRVHVRWDQITSGALLSCAHTQTHPGQDRMRDPVV